MKITGYKTENVEIDINILNLIGSLRKEIFARNKLDPDVSIKNDEVVLEYYEQYGSHSHREVFRIEDQNLCLKYKELISAFDILCRYVKINDN